MQLLDCAKTYQRGSDSLISPLLIQPPQSVTEQSQHQTSPRWGRENRDRKALAILSTLRAYSNEQGLGGVWVDLGCGSGGMAATLAPYVERIIGVDPEPWPDWKNIESSTPNLSFITAPCDKTTPPLPPQSADVIICNQVYEHVASPQNLVANIHRLLKPGGICYFAGPNLLWPIEPHLLWPFIHWLPRRIAQRGMTLLGSSQAGLFDAHSTHYWKLKGWMKAMGFEVSEGVKMRLLHTIESSRMDSLAKIIHRTPRAVFTLLHPVSPGFIFLLRKR